MTEQEKADELWDQMKGFRISHNHRRKCCLVCVDQVINQVSEMDMDGANYLYWKGVRKLLEQKGK